MHRRITTVLVALLLVVSTTAAPAAADSDSIVSDLFDDDDDSTLDAVLGFASGLADRVTHSVTGDDEPADDAAESARKAFNADADDIQAWVNNRSTADSDADVVAVTFGVDGESETDYVVADVDNGSYANLSMVDETDRDVDEECTLSGYAATNADAEVEHFVDNFAEPDNNMTNRYLSELAGRYASNVDCTFSTEGADA